MSKMRSKGKLFREPCSKEMMTLWDMFSKDRKEDDWNTLLPLNDLMPQCDISRKRRSLKREKEPLGKSRFACCIVSILMSVPSDREE